MTTSEAGLQILRDIGSAGIIANAMDADSFTPALKHFRPDAVIEELTSLPREYTPEEMRAAAPQDHRLRIEGGRNLHNAAREAGVKRYIVQSTGFFYAPAQGLATETEPLAVHAAPGVAANVEMYTRLEERVLGSSDPQGVALRYGFFYGPGTYQDPNDGSVTRQVRERSLPVIGAGTGVFSFVHVEDAAAATIAALEAPPGIYNVVDDDAVAMNIWLPAFAQWIGAAEPPRMSEGEALRMAGGDSVYYALHLRGASNARAKRQLGFAPRRLEWLKGVAKHA